MKKIFYIAIFILITLGFTPQVLANDVTTNDNNKVIIYMIDNLSLYDITPQDTPYLWELQAKGSVGLLNTITGGERTIKNAGTTISAGRLAVGSSKANLNFKADTIYNEEVVLDTFYRSTGYKAKPENIVVTNIEVIQKNNEQRKLGKPGQLGDALHELGLTTAVVGNSDRFNIVDRPGALILMDSHGIVDQGQVDNQVNLTDNTLQNYWTNYELLHGQFKSVINSDVILVEYGDLTRLEAMHPVLASTAYKQKRKDILTKIDHSIAVIDSNINKYNTSRYIFSPSPSRNAYIPNALLTPLIIIKPDGENGVLTSHSTRREGIVLLTNLKNSILNNFTPTAKSPVYTVTNHNSYEYLKELNKRAVFSYTNQAFILTILISFLILLFLLTFYLLYKQKYYFLREKLIVLILTLPLALLIMPLFSIYNKYIFIFLTIGLCLLFTYLAIAISKISKINSLSVILFITILAICLDLILGLELIAKSIMSYQIISGARYYGIGNEYMGVLIGATISLAALYAHNSSNPYRFKIITILFALVVFLIAYPLFGINVGGTITACIALSYTLLAFYKPKISYKDIVGILVGTGLVLSIIAILDISKPFEFQSHLGKNINLVTNQGFAELTNLIVRKLEMHLQIINYNYLGWIFLIIFAGIIILFYKPNKTLTEIKKANSSIYTGLKGIIIAAIIAFIFNDSGLTAAATSSLYLISLLIYSLSEHKNKLI